MLHSKEVKTKVRALHSSGIPLKEIAQQLGVKYSTMWEWVSRTRLRRQAARRARVAKGEYKDKRRPYNADYARRKRQEEQSFARRESLNSIVCRSIRGRWHGGKAASILGCPPSWLAEQWDEAYGVGWELPYAICRRRPCSSFDLADPGQQKVCYNWRNLILLPRSVGYTRDIEWSAQSEVSWAWRMRSLGYRGELFLCATVAVRSTEEHHD